MSTRKEVRVAVSALLDAGKSVTAISKDLGCSRRLIYRVKNLKAAGGDYQHQYPVRAGTVLTPMVRAGVKRRIRNAPNKSLRQVARETGLKRETVRRVVIQEGWRSLRRTKVPMVSAEGRKRRLERAKGLLNDLKSAPAHRIVFFSDEKNFVLDPTFNPQNDRYIHFETDSDEEKNPEDPRPEYVPRSKHPASAMFLGAVASTGEVSPPIWFETGFRLGSDRYIKELKEVLIPWMRRVSHAHGASAASPASFVFQQDGAPAHRARKTVQFLNDSKIPFWTPDMWPPNSPDLNPLDYGIWSMVAQGAVDRRPPSVAALKKRVNAFWRRMDPSKIRAVTRAFRARLERCIDKKGSFFD